MNKTIPQCPECGGTGEPDGLMDALMEAAKGAVGAPPKFKTPRIYICRTCWNTFTEDGENLSDMLEDC